MKSQHPLTLEEVQQHFKKWRANKSGSARIPQSLWALVGQLLESSNYKRSAVAKNLGISTHQLRNQFPDFYSQHPSKGKATKKSTDVTLESNTFVKAPLNTVAMPMPATLTIKRGDGIKLSISAPSPEQFSSLIKTFME